MTAVADGLRAVESARRQMLQQAQEERQVVGRDPLLVEGQDKPPDGRLQQEVRVLNPLGDALERAQPAQVVGRQEAAQGIRGDFGIDGHRCLDVTVGDPRA